MRSDNDVMLDGGDGQDGCVVRLRPVRRSDEAALYELCSRSRFQYPFLARSRGSVARYVVRLAADPSPSHAGFVAVRLVDHEVIGLAGYERVGDSELAEAAVVTVDGLDALGVRPLLLEHLAAFARQRGVTTFVEPGVAPLLRPRSVVVVGASARPRTLGYEVVRAVVASGCTGYLQVVSAQAAVVAGVPAVRRIGEVEPPVDVAVLAVPAGAAARALVDCAQIGVRAAVVLGPAAAQERAELEQRARRLGVELECSVAAPEDVVASFAWSAGSPDRPTAVRTAPETEASGAS